MNVLLIQPPIQDFYRTEFREYPLGLLYIAASLQKQNHNVTILDARKSKKGKKLPLPLEFENLKNVYSKNNKLFLHYQHFGISFEEISKKCKEVSPDIIGISSLFTPYHDVVEEIAKQIKEKLPQTKIIVGGHHITSSKDLNSEHIDLFFKGEGELFLQNSSIIENLDSLEFPARDLINQDLYLYNKQRYTMLLTSRGCPNGCTFCSISDRKYRVRSIENVLNEIDECILKHNIKVFDLQDDNLLLKQERIKILFKKVIQKYSKYNLEFMATNGLNPASIDEELITLIKKVGFKKLDISLGTGPVNSRENLKRPETIKEYERIIDLSKKHNLPVTTYVILGLPYQPLLEMKETINYLKDKKTLISPSVFYNVPGMKIFEEMKKYEINSKDFCRRSSSFNSFGEDFTQDDIINIFKEIREYNLSIKK